jgi:aspartate-semialdehyde dehydrogenase
MKEYKVAVVGVGAVGKEILRTLKQRNFPISSLKVLARSAREMELDGFNYQVESIDHSSFKGIEIALFAGTEGEKGASVTYAPSAVKEGAVVIDNGADFRLKADVPLVVPEVNGADVKNNKGIISNPNCSTIQMVVALNPIYKLSKIKRIIASTYQAASGAGQSACDELYNQTAEFLEGKDLTIKAFSKRIAFNVIPQIGGFVDMDYTSEEWKLVHETHKILHDEEIRISATTIRVPVKTGHSESVYIETQKPLSVEEVKEALSNSAGIKVIDDVKEGKYPMPCFSEGTDEVFVGRIRKDPYVPEGIWLWIVADNLRKGAALNAVQIAEELIKG